MAYETFAFVYDEVMDDSLYKEWSSFTQRHIPKNTQRLLDLACGTGALACEFAKAGYQVTALDLSTEMLSVASQRALSQACHVQFIEGDMTDLSEVGTYEAITCFSDSLCYMPNHQAVQQVFDTVYEALEEGGVFLFDVHSIYQMDELFPTYSYHYQTEDFAFLWDSYPGDKPYSVEHFLTFFIAEKTEPTTPIFRRFDELHQERTYTLDNYQRMLENANFQKVQVYGDFADEHPDEKTKRWFFVCEK